MTKFTRRFRRPLACLVLVVTIVAVGGSGGCGGKGNGKSKKAFMSLGSAPPGGAFFTVGGAIADALNKYSGENNWEFTNNSTKGSQDNIRNLDSKKLELALSNSAISYFAVNGGGAWDKKHEIRTVVTLAPNVAVFITKAKSGINTLADLRGKRVTLGPSGAGFKMFIEPILEAHGVPYSSFTLQNGTYSQAVESLTDGATDAAFLGGAIPTAAVQTATNTFSVHFIPFDATAREKLVNDYAFFDEVPIKAGTYKGQDKEIVTLNCGSMHLITSAAMDEEVIYQLTKTIWENRKEIASKHGAGKAINEKNAARFTGTPFHAGAIRFYKEIKIWKEPGGKKGDAGAQKSEKKPEPKKAVEKKAEPKKAEPKKAVEKKAVEKKAVEKKAVEKKAVEKKAVEKTDEGKKAEKAVKKDAKQPEKKTETKDGKK